MKDAKCPACRTTIVLEEDPEVNDLVECPKCKTILEIVRIDPPRLDWTDEPVTAPVSRRKREG